MPERYIDLQNEINRLREQRREAGEQMLAEGWPLQRPVESWFGFRRETVRQWSYRFRERLALRIAPWID